VPLATDPFCIIPLATVLGKLLISPISASGLLRHTIDTYSLTQAAIERVRAWKKLIALLDKDGAEVVFGSYGPSSISDQAPIAALLYSSTDAPASDVGRGRVVPLSAGNGSSANDFSIFRKLTFAGPTSDPTSSHGLAHQVES
jgi:hypothetical protein